MIILTDNKQYFFFSDDILKISTWFEDLYIDYGDSPMPMMNYEAEAFEYFIKWFDDFIVSSCFNNECSEYQIYFDNIQKIYKPEIFENCNLSLLIKILNFAVGNEIKILIDTIATVIGSRNVFINRIVDFNTIGRNLNYHYYISEDGDLSIVDNHVRLILRNMKPEIFDKQWQFIKDLI